MGPIALREPRAQGWRPRASAAVVPELARPWARRRALAGARALGLEHQWYYASAPLRPRRRECTAVRARLSAAGRSGRTSADSEISRTQSVPFDSSNRERR